MSQGRIYLSEMDALIGQSVTQLEEKVMRDAQYIIETAHGLILAMNGQNNKGPFVITVPYGTDLNAEIEEGKKLVDKIKEMGNIEEVRVGTKNYVTVETAPATNRTGA